MSSRIPEGFSTITPTIVSKDASRAIEYYKKAFGATEVHRMMNPKTGKVMHACLTIGTSKLFLSDEMPEMGCVALSNNASPVNFYLYFEDADKAQQKAVAAGMTEFMPVTDMFWGDRMGCVVDAEGYRWNIAHFVREVSPEELEKGAREMAECNPGVAA